MSASGRFSKSIPASRIICAKLPSGQYGVNVGNAVVASFHDARLSNFLAVQGMIDTTYMSLGSTLNLLGVERFGESAPSIVWGDLQVDR